MEKLDNKKNLKILLADDDEITATLLNRISTNEKWNLKIAKNGKELIEEMEIEEYDLILTDIQMPVMNGLEAIKIIRQNSKYDKLPIIVMSAFAMDDEIKIALKTGANGYIVKPISIGKLKEVVCLYIEEK